MPYKILKQFQPGTATVWVEKLTVEDTLDIFETEAEASAKVEELKTANPTRKFKFVEV